MKGLPGRIVEPELLDELSPQDRRALRSRLDLRRLNQWMRHPRTMAKILRENLTVPSAPHIVELGAGDGHFLLSVAHCMRRRWPRAEATLVDRLDTFDSRLRQDFNKLGWQVRVDQMAADQWLSSPNAADVIINNLFLHQFKTDDLAEMLRLAAQKTRLFVALEPRRSWLSMVFGHLLWAIRCNSVTRHDANISIRAGFSGPELSALWLAKEHWHLEERPVGVFSHLFIAKRKE